MTPNNFGADPDVKVVSTGYPDSNTMVVDGGEWKALNTIRETWSDSLTCNTAFVSSRPPTQAFDTDTSNYASSDGTQGVMTFTSPVAMPTGCKLEVWGKQSFASKTIVTVNGGSEQLIDGGGFQEVTYAPGDEAGFVITIKADSDTANTHFAGLRINGNILVDDQPIGGDPDGAPVVEYQTKGGEGTIVSVNTDDNTLLVADTGDRDNRWIKGFSVAGPSIIDEPLLTNQVDLRGSDFATTPPGADTLKEIIWSINGTEYSAGVTNPWSPLEKLPTNSTVTVKVKYKGNTLEDSEWSPDVTFTTGATLRSLFSRIAALEANDVTDDATDTALITLIAGLAARIETLESDHMTLMNNNNSGGY